MPQVNKHLNTFLHMPLTLSRFMWVTHLSYKERRYGMVSQLSKGQCTEDSRKIQVCQNLSLSRSQHLMT
jgi:hypothetical protein